MMPTHTQLELKIKSCQEPNEGRRKNSKMFQEVEKEFNKANTPPEKLEHIDVDLTPSIKKKSNNPPKPGGTAFVSMN